MRVAILCASNCPTKVKQAEMQKAWQSACLCEDASGFLNLETAEMLCSTNNGRVLPQTQHDKRWFFGAYCDGRGFERNAAESVWDLVTLPVPRETIAMVACVPVLVHRFYSPESFAAQPPARNNMVQGSIEHRVIGASATAQSASALKEFVVETMLTGVRRAPIVSNPPYAPDGITPSNTQQLDCQVQASRIKEIAPPLVVITDAGQDLDDEAREITLHLRPLQVLYLTMCVYVCLYR